MCKGSKERDKRIAMPKAGRHIGSEMEERKACVQRDWTQRLLLPPKAPAQVQETRWSEQLCKEREERRYIGIYVC